VQTNDFNFLIDFPISQFSQSIFVFLIGFQNGIAFSESKN